MYSSSKGDEFSSQLDDLMEGLNQSDVSDPSGSPTSERKSVLEGMKNEELKEYYTKNLKRQKLMAKLKKKKWSNRLNFKPIFNIIFLSWNILWKIWKE